MEYDITTEFTNEKALRDTTGLMIGLMFKDVTGSNELLEETQLAIGNDPERLWGMLGTLLNLLHNYVGNNHGPTGWKELVDHLCDKLDIPVPE
jgi:hypothetical protein